MKMRLLGMALLVAGLAACSGSEDEAAEPGALALTPGAWAANESQASFADDNGTLLATFRCNSDTQELVLEIPGGFAEGARAAMVMRAGDFMHGIDPVEVRGSGDSAMRIAPMPVAGPVSQAIVGFPVPLTIESDGSEPLMIETDAVLQDYIGQCAGSAGDAVQDNGQ